MSMIIAIVMGALVGMAFLALLFTCVGIGVQGAIEEGRARKCVSFLQLLHCVGKRGRTKMQDEENVEIEIPNIQTRVEYLRSEIALFVGKLEWKVQQRGATDLDHVSQVLQRHSFSSPGMPSPFQSADLESMMRSKRLRSFAVTHLLSWIMISSISLDSDPSWNLISPALAHMWEACRLSHTDAENTSIWHKARVLLCKNLWPMIHPFEDLVYDRNRQPLNSGAHDRILALLIDLLEPFVVINKKSRLHLDHNLLRAAYLGLFIHMDLRPWQWSFEYGGVHIQDMERVDEAPLCDQTPDPHYEEYSVVVEYATAQFRSPMLPYVPVASQSPFRRLSPATKISPDQIVCHPSLFATGDATGMGFEKPVLVIPPTTVSIVLQAGDVREEQVV